MKTGLLNLILLVLALALAMGSSLILEKRQVVIQTRNANAVKPSEFKELTELEDARSNLIPVKAYQRVLSLNTVSDQLLLNLIEPGRLIGVTDYALKKHSAGWRLTGRESFPSRPSLEALLSAHPDLIVISKFADESQLARIQEAGIEVFDLGDMRGVETTRANIRALATLLKVPERGALLERQYLRQLHGLSIEIPVDEKPWGLYMSVYGDAFYGGTSRTSYADMLSYGGVRDLAAKFGYEEWPSYTPADLLRMDPSLVITQEGMAQAICEHGSIGEISACRPPGRIIELPGIYHSDPGLGVIESAYEVRRAVHGGMNVSARK